jgi:phosphocarrier protein
MHEGPSEDHPSTTRCKQTFTVTVPLGLHLRPAAALVKRGSQFRSRITLQCNGAEANGKSLLDITLLGVLCGQELTIVTDGDDAREAMLAIADLFSLSLSG